MENHLSLNQQIRKEDVFATTLKKSEKILHIIRLKGFEFEEGKIPFSLLCQLSNQIKKISEGTLRLYIEGNSLLKRGTMPEWLKSSLDFTWSGLSKGSTILKMEAPLLKDTLMSIQYPLFNELGSEDFSKDTAFSLAMAAYQKAISAEKETDLLDKFLLNEMLTFRKIVAKEKTSIQMSCPANKRKAILNKENFEKISILEVTTPPPIKVKVNGKLDMMKHSSSLLEILSGTRIIKVKLPENMKIEDIKSFFGKQISITGLANFNPAHELVSILLSDIQSLSQEDLFFTQRPKVLKDKTDLKQLISEKKYKGTDKTKLDSLIDEMAVEEPIEVMLNALTR